LVQHPNRCAIASPPKGFEFFIPRLPEQSFNFFDDIAAFGHRARNRSTQAIFTYKDVAIDTGGGTKQAKSGSTREAFAFIPWGWIFDGFKQDAWPSAKS
jgi:hypothetical protein